MSERRYLKEFVFIQIAVEFGKDTVTPKSLYLKLMEWTRLLRESNDSRIKAFYDSSFLYFERFNIDEYQLEPLWYDFNELINYDFLKPTPARLETAVLIVRDILWEIIAFKTDRHCKLLKEDNLRLLTDDKREEVFFCCDACSYTERLDGKPIEPTGILFPATKAQILKYNIRPYKYKRDNDFPE